MKRLKDGWEKHLENGKKRVLEKLMVNPLIGKFLCVLKSFSEHRLCAVK